VTNFVDRRNKDISTLIYKCKERNVERISGRYVKVKQKLLHSSKIKTYIYREKKR